MATTRFTKSLHQQATKHNNARGGFTNLIKRGPVGEHKPIMGVWQWSPRAQWGPGTEGLVRKSFQFYLSLDKQRAAVCMGVIA